MSCCIGATDPARRPSCMRIIGNFAAAEKLASGLERQQQRGIPMRKYLFATAAAATVAIAAPAAATADNSGYVGLEGGVLFPKSQSVTGTIDFTTTGTPGPVNFGPSRVATVKSKTGYDIDVIGGYDFGMFRVEGELGYKRARAKSIRVSDAFI